MKALHTILALLLLTAGCDQPQGSQLDRDTTLEHNESTLQPNQRVAPQASTIQQVPGSTEAELVASRKLLDNIATNDDLSTFAALIRSANLTQSLNGTGPYTVLAPTESAFDSLPDSVRQQLSDPAQRDHLQDLLNNHIIAGKLTTTDLQDGAMLKTVAGRQLKVVKRDGKVRIGQAWVVAPDGINSNGVLHTLNRVLVPVAEN